jgi:Cu2+-exporting ATPase
LGWASEKAIVEGVLGSRPGVLAVEANPVSQTATVTFDSARTSVADLRQWVTECGYHCSGESVPLHVCDPMGATAAHEVAAREALPPSHEMMGHGGHAGMSMESMTRDMRNRFAVAAVFSVPIVLWSPIGRSVAALSMSGSSVLVAINALLLKRLRLPGTGGVAGNDHMASQSAVPPGAPECG